MLKYWILGEKHVKKKITFLSIILMLMALVLVQSSTVDISALSVPAQELQVVEDGVDLETGEIVDDGSSEDDEGEGDVLFEGVAISSKQITDENLYSALLKAYKFEYSGTERAYTGSVIYSDMFKDMKTINLDSSKTKLSIKSLEGLSLLEFDSLESFSANLNTISEFSASYFANTNPENFKSLSLAGNSISNISLTGLTGLYSINLSSNQISKIDLSAIEGADGGNTIVSFNLAGNQLKSMSDIKLPTRRIGHITLNIIGNNITTIDEKYFSDNYTLQIGLQGFQLEDEIAFVDTADNLVIYETGIDNLSVLVRRIDGDFDEDIGTYPTTSIEGGFQRLNLEVGMYEFEYLLDGVSAYSKSDIDRKYLTSHVFNVIPQGVDYKFIFKGKEYTQLGKVTGVVKVVLTSKEDATIYYSVNGSDWVEGTEINCNKGGNYNIVVKSVINGYESQEQNIWVRTSLNTVIPDILMLILVLLLAVVLFFVVLPIISKKYFKRD